MECNYFIYIYYVTHTIYFIYCLPNVYACLFVFVYVSSYVANCAFKYMRISSVLSALMARARACM